MKDEKGRKELLDVFRSVIDEEGEVARPEFLSAERSPVFRSSTQEPSATTTVVESTSGKPWTMYALVAVVALLLLVIVFMMMREPTAVTTPVAPLESDDEIFDDDDELVYAPPPPPQPRQQGAVSSHDRVAAQHDDKPSKSSGDPMFQPLA